MEKKIEMQMESFKDRLRKFREENGYTNKKEFANKLDINPNVYYMLESGTRTPSNDVINKLVQNSDYPSAYWEYGYIDVSNKYKHLIQALDTLNILNDSEKVNDLLNEYLELIQIALKADSLTFNAKK
mgnify:CR=1 FL=1